MYYPDHPDFLTTRGTWDYFLAAPFFNAPPHTIDKVTSLGMIGLAGGTIPKQYTSIFGPIPIDGFEIDPDIVEIGREYFNMTESNLNVVVQDGRYGLSVSPNTYDVIGIDAYRMPYIPWHLTTVEFFQEVHDHLSDRGTLAINVGRTVNDRRLIDAFAMTLQQVFPSVHVMDVPRTCNTIMVATVQETIPENLLANLKLLPEGTNPVLPETMALAYQVIKPTPQTGEVFTDDRAAVELLTDALVVNFVLSGETDRPCQ
jgi:hypothetical protein